jgi:glycosyltransferase involved in cell wall biosynthesis
MPESPRVSVAVINYNYADFVSDAIDSVLAQTYPNIELIVVDDESTDDSRLVIDGYGDRVVRVYKHNGGQGSSINAGFEAASGEIVMFLDADDILLPDIVGKVVAAFTAEPGTAMVQFRLEVADATGQPLGVIVPPEPGHLPSGDLREHVLRYRNWASQPTSGLAFASDSLKRIMPIPEHLYRGSADTYLEELIVFCGLITSLDDVGFYYRMHGRNDFIGRTANADWFRERIRLIQAGHEHVKALTGELGIGGVPAEATDVPDPAFLAYRLASLKLDRAGHPIPQDRPLAVARDGVRASLGQPQLPLKARLKRAAWFAAVALAPPAAGKRLVRDYTPDGPRRPRWEQAERAHR